jgi:hypothetical protein
METKITFLQFIAAMAFAVAAWNIADLLYSIYISPGIPF